MRELRDKNNFSQNKIAEFLDMSQVAYHKLESGKSNIDLDNLESLAKFYKTTISELCGETAGVIIHDYHNNPNSKIAGTINLKEINNDKDKILKIYETRIVELEEKIKRKDLKIEELKKAGEKKK